MSDAQTDPLIAALAAQIGEEEAQLRAAWESVLHGELSADEVAETCAAAGASVEQIEIARALYAPHTDSEREALLDGVFARAAVSTDAAPPGSAPVANMGGRSARWMVAGLALAAAAALLLVWWSAAPNPQQQPRVAALPLYQLEVADEGLASKRSESKTRPEHRYHQLTEFDWRLRPRVDVEGDVATKLFAISAQGQAREIEGLEELAPSGGVRWRGRVSELGLGPGDWTMVLVVGRPDELPPDANVAQATQDGERVQIERLNLTIVD